MTESTWWKHSARSYWCQFIKHAQQTFHHSQWRGAVLIGGVCDLLYRVSSLFMLDSSATLFPLFYCKPTQSWDKELNIYFIVLVEVNAPPQTGHRTNRKKSKNSYISTLFSRGHLGQMTYCAICPRFQRRWQEGARPSVRAVACCFRLHRQGSCLNWTCTQQLSFWERVSVIHASAQWVWHFCATFRIGEYIDSSFQSENK